MLGHELRNPLSPILTALQLMNLRGSDETERERTIIERQVKHLVRLVDDLLDVSRLTLGKIRLVVEPVELAAVVEQAVEAVRPLIDQAGHRLAVELPTVPINLEGDKARLTQVLTNLLNNAA
jgi:signal transduction histidine kinase